MNTWKELNTTLRSTKDENAVFKMLQEERQGARRPRWMKRIYSRYSVLRKKREKKELQ